MKRNILIAFFSLVSISLLQAQTKYTPTDTESKVAFAIKNFGIKTNGSFTGLKGAIQFDPLRPELSSFEVTVDANSINTDNGKRDNHLRKEEYFNVEKFKTLQYKSSSIKKLSGTNQYHVEGTITIKGTAKQVGFDFTATQKSGGYLFEGSFEINRRDYGVGGGSVSMSDNLEVSLLVFGKG